MLENRRHTAFDDRPASEKEPDCGWAWIFDQAHFEGITDELCWQPSRLAEAIAFYKRAAQEAAPPEWFMRHLAASGHSHAAAIRSLENLGKMQNFYIERYCRALADICRNNQLLFCGWLTADESLACRQALDREVSQLLGAMEAPATVRLPIFQSAILEANLEAIEDKILDAQMTDEDEAKQTLRLQGYQAQKKLLLNLIKNLEAYDNRQAAPKRPWRRPAPD